MRTTRLARLMATAAMLLAVTLSMSVSEAAKPKGCTATFYYCSWTVTTNSGVVVAGVAPSEWHMVIWESDYSDASFCAGSGNIRKEDYNLCYAKKGQHVELFVNTAGIATARQMR